MYVLFSISSKKVSRKQNSIALTKPQLPQTVAITESAKKATVPENENMSEILNKNVFPRFICKASCLLCGFCNALGDFRGVFGRGCD